MNTLFGAAVVSARGHGLTSQRARDRLVATLRGEGIHDARVLDAVRVTECGHGNRLDDVVFGGPASRPHRTAGFGVDVVALPARPGFGDGLHDRRRLFGDPFVGDVGGVAPPWCADIDEHVRQGLGAAQDLDGLGAPLLA